MPDVITSATVSPATGPAPADVTALRWEWRIFSPGPLIARVQHLVTAPAGARSYETYVVSGASVHNVKIRGGRLEVKRLVATAHGGLELWQPALTERFPVDARAVGVVCDALGTAAPASAATDWSAPAFLADFVARAPDLTAVSVTKRRTPLRSGLCSGEYVELVADHARWVSVAFEDPDPTRVIAAVTALGFAIQENTNYPAALKRIVRATPANAVPDTQETP